MAAAIDDLHRGLLLVLSSPSGAGKSTIARMLLDADDRIGMSVSATTRAIRPGEVDGQDYHFVDEARFEEMVAAGEFLEWAHVFGRRYGTPRGPVDAALSAGRDVLFDIDWQGTQQLHAKAGQDLVRVFILPPSLEELERRLRGRGTEPAEVIEARLATARIELAAEEEFDATIVNTSVAEAAEALVRLIRGTLDGASPQKDRQ